MLAALVILVTGCTEATSETSETTQTTVTTPSATSPPTTHPSPPRTAPTFEEVTIHLAETGTHLVDAEGRTIYLFTLDDERTSGCEGACAEAWPPVVGDPVAGDGVSQELLGNAERSDGSIQVTYGGYPLYTYTGDPAPGDANGQGFNDVWFMVTPEGDPLS